MAEATLEKPIIQAQIVGRQGGLRVFVTPLLRCLLFLMGAFAVLLFAYYNVTHWRSDAANAVSTPLGGGTRIGQSFVSRYPDLSGVEVRLSPSKLGGARPGATLVMHLRASPSSGPDLRTATLHLSNNFGENDYQFLSFAPLPDSLDKSFYVEFESPDSTAGNALALMWWVQFDPNLHTDPYAGGTSYLNLQPQQSDLAFGLVYSTAPITAFHLLARHATANFPKGLMLALLSLGALLTALFVALTFWVRLHSEGVQTALLEKGSSPTQNSKVQDEGCGTQNSTALRRTLLKYALPIALFVALVNGLVFAFLVPPWQGTDEHGHFMYAALLYRHDMDDGAVKQLQWQAGGKDYPEVVALKDAIVASMNANDWTRLVSGHPTPGASAFPPGDTYLYTEFMWETRQPPLYYWLCAASLHVAQWLGLQADPLADPQSALRVMRLVSVLLNLGVVALAWLAGRLLSRRGRARIPWKVESREFQVRKPTFNYHSWLPFLLPLIVAALPMHTFIASITSNDIISELNVTALFVSLVALLEWPTGWRGAGFVLLSLLLLAATSMTKLTATVAGAPLYALGMLVWLGVLLTRRVGHRGAFRGATARPLRALLVPGIVAGAFLMLCLAGGLLVFRQDRLVAAWQSGGGPSARPLQVQTASAHNGLYVMQVETDELDYQWVALPWPHQAYTVTLSAWVRPAMPVVTAAPAAAIGMGRLLLDQRGTLARIGAETLASSIVSAPIRATAAGAWTHFTMQAYGGNADRKVWIRFQPQGRAMQIDDVSLVMSSTVSLAAGNLPSAVTALPVYNPSAEQGSISVSPLGQRLLRGEAADVIDVLVNPQAFSKMAVWGRYADREYRSFVGNFGWLSIPLPELLYTAVEWLCVLALLGLVLVGVRRRFAWGNAEWLGLVVVIALAAAIVLTFARQMASLPTTGVHTDPQGRYLFGFTVPLVWLLLTGCAALLSVLAQWVRRLQLRLPGTVRALSDRGERAAPPVPWGAWFACYAVLLFSLFCVVGLIALYYYK